MCLFKCKNQEYKDFFASLLGWKDFCDCGMYVPYYHTHTLVNKYDVIYKKYKCADCEFCFVFDHAVFGKRLDRGNFGEYRVYKCPVCSEEISVHLNLILEPGGVYGDYMKEEQEEQKEQPKVDDINIEKLAKDKVEIEQEIYEYYRHFFFLSDIPQKTNAELRRIKNQKRLNEINTLIDNYITGKK